MTDTPTNDNANHGTLKERLEQQQEGYEFPKTDCAGRSLINGRKLVKEAIVRAYELHGAVTVLQDLLQQDAVKSNPIVSQELQASLDAKKPHVDQVLEVPNSLLTLYEQDLREVAKYQMEHKVPDLGSVPQNKRLTTFLGRKRNDFSYFKSGKRRNPRAETVQCLKDDMGFFRRLQVRVDPMPLGPIKSFDDRIEQLKAFKAKHGHLRVRQIQVDGSNLGEWVKRVRREYDDYVNKPPNENKTFLTPERIELLNEMGFIWKIRHGRPKKGDPRYRLRRKSNDETEPPSTPAPGTPAPCTPAPGTPAPSIPAPGIPTPASVANGAVEPTGNNKDKFCCVEEPPALSKQKL